jgi:hypothetical protein
MTNILSLSQVKQEYDVSYDGDDFIIHRAKRISRHGLQAALEWAPCS